MYSHDPHDADHNMDPYLTHLQPNTILLKDGETTATMYPIPSNPDLLPIGLLAFLLDEFNMEVEKGDSFPDHEPLSLDEFKKFWFDANGLICIMILGEIPELDYSINDEQGLLDKNHEQKSAQYLKRKERRNLNLNIQWEKQCLGTFNLKPAYPGRSSHVVTATFLVNAGIRGKGIGRTLVECFLDWAPQLGFTSSYFPLVYGTNVGIRRILESTNFKRIGKLPESGILKGYDSPVDSFIYGKEFTHVSKQIDAINSARNDSTKAKYERLRVYLETGEYPALCSRNEKARLRVMSKTHSILNGRLLFKGREVIYDTERQLQIAFETHLVDHQGINKVTSKVAEKFHWKGIKHSVAQVIGTCPKCQDHVGYERNGHPISTKEIIIDTTDSPNHPHILVHRHNHDQLNNVTTNLITALESESVLSSNQSITGRKSTIQRLKFESDTGKEIVTRRYITNNKESMNAFMSYAQEQRKRPRYSDIASGIIRKNNSSVEESDTILLDDTSSNIVDDALLNLEDNVIAAVEAVHKEQQEYQRIKEKEPSEQVTDNDLNETIIYKESHTFY